MNDDEHEIPDDHQLESLFSGDCRSPKSQKQTLWHELRPKPNGGYESVGVILSQITWPAAFGQKQPVVAF